MLRHKFLTKIQPIGGHVTGTHDTDGPIGFKIDLPPLKSRMGPSIQCLIAGNTAVHKVRPFDRMLPKVGHSL